MKEKLRLILFTECDKNCGSCCRKDLDMEKVPYCGDFSPYKEIYLTGGEPCLDWHLLERVCGLIKIFNPQCQVILYTARLDEDRIALNVLRRLIDGITLTLHDEIDTKKYLKGIKRLAGRDYQYKELYPLSLRLKVFKEAETEELLQALEEIREGWKVKTGIEGIKNCPVPEGEELMRLPKYLR